MALPGDLRCDFNFVRQRAIAFRHNPWNPLCMLCSVVTCHDMVAGRERARSSERLLCLAQLLALDCFAYVRSDEVQSCSQRSSEQKHCQRLVGCGVQRVQIPQQEFDKTIVEWSKVSMACLNVWTKRSASPLVAGWYSALQMWRMPFALANSANSSDANCGPLSLMMIS